MATEKKTPRTTKACQRGRAFLRNVCAVVNTASFVVLALHIRQTALVHSKALPFQWQMLICMLEGYMLPLTIIGCATLCNILFWKRDATIQR